MIRYGIAFYKGEGTIFDKLIRWWTNSDYSHSEIIIDYQWYTSSPRDGGVVTRTMYNYKEEHWDFYEFNFDTEYAMNAFNAHNGEKYDWLGIALTDVIPLGIQDPRRMRCSELNATMLNIHNAREYNPEELFQKIKLMYNH